MEEHINQNFHMRLHSKEKRKTNRCSLCEEAHYTDFDWHFCGTVNGGESDGSRPRVDVLVCRKCAGMKMFVNHEKRKLLEDVDGYDFSCKCAE